MKRNLAPFLLLQLSSIASVISGSMVFIAIPWIALEITGNSASAGLVVSLTAAEALKAAGANVVAVATVVDRDTGARQAIEAAGFAYLTAITLEDLGLTK